MRDASFIPRLTHWEDDDYGQEEWFHWKMYSNTLCDKKGEKKYLGLFEKYNTTLDNHDINSLF